MDRIIEVKVFGNHLTKDSKNAGTRGEANVTKLRITFDEGWTGYAKEAIFWDAYGENAVRILITENLMEKVGVYLIPIPAEAMARAGMLTFTIRGAQDNTIQASITSNLEVKDAPDILEPIPPTPTELQQMQTEVEDVIDKIVDAAEATKAIENMSVSAETVSPGEKAFVHKNKTNGSFNLHFGIPEGEKGDTGNSGVYIGTEEPEDPEVKVWIEPTRDSYKAPQKMRKIGKTFVAEDSSLYHSDVSEILSFESFPANGISALGYKNTAGNFVSAFYKNNKKYCTYTGGTGAGHSTMSNGRLVHAEAADGILNILTATAHQDSPTLSAWTTVQLQTTDEVILRHVFLRWIVSTSVYELTVIYATPKYNYLYIDRFTVKSGEPTLTWQKKLLMNSYVSSDTRLLYGSWFRMACIDGSGTLYVAPFYCSPEPYAVLRFNSDGEITGRYLKVLWAGQPQFVMRDLILDGRYLYGYTAVGITRIDTETGTETCMYEAMNGNIWHMRGLMLLPDGHLAFYGISVSTGQGHILLLYTTDEEIVVHSTGILSDTLLAEPALFCRSVNAFSPEIQGLYLDEDTGDLSSKRFIEYDTYSIL